MKNARYVLTGLIIAGLLVATVLLIKKTRPAGTVRVSASEGKTKGTKGAKIQIVEYSDFQCPACARAVSSVEKIMEDPDFKGKIQFTYRHFPLSGHQWSGLAHQAAECANEQGKFWEFHDKLYQYQAIWAQLENPTEDFLRYARELNLSMDTYGVCLANPDIHYRVMQEKKKGEDLQIRSTPTFFINGERLVGPIELENKGDEVVRKILGLPLKQPAAPAPVPAPAVESVSSPAPQASPSADSSSASPAPAASPAV